VPNEQQGQQETQIQGAFARLLAELLKESEHQLEVHAHAPLPLLVRGAPPNQIRSLVAPIEATGTKVTTLQLVLF